MLKFQTNEPENARRRYKIFDATMKIICRFYKDHKRI